MKHWCWLLLLLSSISWSTPQIKVGGYLYAPFVVKQANDQYAGLTLDLIAKLNEVQQEVRFVFVPTSAANRYKALEVGRFSLMLFEDANWGWQALSPLMSRPFLGGGEVYVALKQPGRDQRFFDDLQHRQLIGVTGYHYGVAQFNADPDYLAAHLNIILLKDNINVLQALLMKRGEVAILNLSYLKQFLTIHPELAERLLVSEKWDQRYQHRALLSQKASLSLDQLQQWLDILQKKGELDRLWTKYGIQDYAIP